MCARNQTNEFTTCQPQAIRLAEYFTILLLYHFWLLYLPYAAHRDRQQKNRKTKYEK